MPGTAGGSDEDEGHKGHAQPSHTFTTHRSQGATGTQSHVPPSSTRFHSSPPRGATHRPDPYPATSPPRSQFMHSSQHMPSPTRGLDPRGEEAPAGHTLLVRTEHYLPISRPTVCAHTEMHAEASNQYPKSLSKSRSLVFVLCRMRRPTNPSWRPRVRACYTTKAPGGCTRSSTRALPKRRPHGIRRAAVSEYRCNIPVHRAMDAPTVAVTAARVGGLRWTSCCAA